MKLAIKFMVIIAAMTGGLMLGFFVTVLLITSKALSDEIDNAGAIEVQAVANLGMSYIENVYNDNFLESLLRDANVRQHMHEEITDIAKKLPLVDSDGRKIGDREIPDPTSLREFENAVVEAIIDYYQLRNRKYMEDPDRGGGVDPFQNPTAGQPLQEAFKNYCAQWSLSSHVRSALAFWQNSLKNFLYKLRQAYRDDFFNRYVDPLVTRNSRIQAVLFRPDLRSGQTFAKYDTLDTHPQASLPEEGHAWAGDQNVTIQERDGDRQFMYVVTARLASLSAGDTETSREYRAVVQFDSSVVDAAQNRLMLYLGLIAVLSIIIGICVSYFLAHTITKPINTLAEDVGFIARGDYAHRTRAKPRNEIGVLARSIDAMCEELQRAEQTRAQLGEAKHEMNLAEEIIIHLLPDALPKIFGYDTYAFYNPSKDVGGDYYDFYPIDANHLGIIVADVSGKGIAGAMVMTMARTVLKYEAQNNLSPRETFVKANRLIARDIKRGMFVTAFFIVLNTQTAEMLVASAGHNPMYLWRQSTGKVEHINPNGIALGFDKGPIFERTIKEEKVRLYSGDRVVLYTDGVVEAMSPDNEEYTDERLIDLIEQNPELPSNALTNLIVQDVQAHQSYAEQHDDITLVTFKLN